MTELTPVPGRGDVALFVRHWPRPQWGISGRRPDLARPGRALRPLRAARRRFNAAGFEVYAHDHRGQGQSVRDASSDTSAPMDGTRWSTTWSRWARRSTPAAAVLAGAPGALDGIVRVQQYLLDHSDEIVAAVLTGTRHRRDLREYRSRHVARSDAGERSVRGTDGLRLVELRRPKRSTVHRPTPRWFSADADALGGHGGAASGRSRAPCRSIRRPPDLWADVGKQRPVERARRQGSWSSSPSATATPRSATSRPSADHGARHEVFNETNQYEVTSDLIAWLDRHVRSRDDGPASVSPRRSAADVQRMVDGPRLPGYAGRPAPPLACRRVRRSRAGTATRCDEYRYDWLTAGRARPRDPARRPLRPGRCRHDLCPLGSYAVGRACPAPSCTPARCPRPASAQRIS